MKILDEKKIYKNDGIGCLKQFTSKAVIDFFMFPDNDLLDDWLGSKEFFTNVLYIIGWSAHWLAYFSTVSNLLLFLKINFSTEIGDFDKKIVEDDNFAIFSGYERGPTTEEVESYKIVEMSPR